MDVSEQTNEDRPMSDVEDTTQLPVTDCMLLFI
jgi:hypothetical protein